MDEDQENVRAMKSDEEEDHKKDARKLVEMVQKEKAEQEGQWGRVAPDMGAGGSHPQATSDSQEGREEERPAKGESERGEEAADGEQQHSEEKEET